MNFTERLKENDFMQYAYKAWHQKNYIWSDEDFITKEHTDLTSDILFLYSKGLKHFNITDILVSQGREIKVETFEPCIIQQCKLCFEYDCFAELRRVNNKRLKEFENGEKFLEKEAIKYKEGEIVMEEVTTMIDDK